jgi:uncharacterized protein YbjT (DUF2867 family)
VPVVVTAAETRLGRLVVARLKAEGAEVRAVVDKRADDLGVPTSKADWGDAERLGAVMEGAHTVIHLAGRKRVPALLEAVEDTSVFRIVSTVPVDWPLRGSGEFVLVEVPRWRPDLEAVADTLVEADRRV